jgi:chromosome segregation ATPase
VDCLRKIGEQEIQVHTTEWLLKRQDLDQQLAKIDIDQLLQRHTEPQEPRSFETAEQDIKEISSLTDKLRRAKELLQNAWNWLNQNPGLPDEVRKSVTEQLQNEQSKIDNEESKLKDFEQQLTHELKRQKELADQIENLTQQLNLLREEASTFHEGTTPEQKTAQIQELQQRVQPLLQKAEELQRKTELQSSPFVYDKNDLQDLKSNVEGLQKTLETSQKEAGKQIQLAKVEDKVKDHTLKLMEEIQSADLVLSNPEATVEELRKSSEILEIARPRLDEIYKFYEDLDPGDESTQDLRNRTADQLSKLNELFNNNQQSARDRIDTIVGQQHDEVIYS